jgi:O-antigen ligase
MSVVVLLGTGSRTSWLALLIAVGVATAVVGVRPLGERVGTRRAALIVGSTGGVSVAALAYTLHRLWSESTFVQRRTIWSQVWDSIRDRPIRGHGFFAVWEVPAFIAQHPLFDRGSGHGSALEVWLGLGLLGLIPFAVIVALALRGALRDAWTRPSPASWVWLAAIVLLVIENITESFVLWFSYNWVLLMAAALRSGMTRTGPGEESRVRSRQADPDRPGTVQARSASAQPVAALP